MGISELRRDDRLSSEPPLGELLADVAGHAQGIIRTEVRLAVAEIRQDVQAAVRRVVLVSGAAVFAVIGMIALMIAGALALATVVSAWLAVCITAVVVLLMSVAMFGLAGRPTA